MSLAGKDFKIQVNNSDGSGSWNEVVVAIDASPSLTADLLDTTHFGDEAMRRIRGLIDAGLDLEINTEASPSDAVTDIRSAALDLNAEDETLDVEFSPDGNAASGGTEIIKFVAKVSSFDYAAAADGAQTISVTLENANGAKPTFPGSFS